MHNVAERVFVKPVESDNQNVVFSTDVIPMYIGSSGEINTVNLSNPNSNMSNLTWFTKAEKKRLFKIIDPFELENYNESCVYSLIYNSNLVVDKSTIKPENDMAKIVPFENQFVVQQKNKTY